MAAEDQVALTEGNITLHHKEITSVTSAWRLRDQPDNVSYFQRDRVLDHTGCWYSAHRDGPGRRHPQTAGASRHLSGKPLDAPTRVLMLERRSCHLQSFHLPVPWRDS